MHFNLDCARDILIYKESKPLGDLTYLKVLINDLPEYTEEEIIYACIKLDEAGFLTVPTASPCLSATRPQVVCVKEITYQGHAFLDNVRNDSIWTEAKKKTKNMGTVALDIVSQVAASLISNKLGL